MADFLFEIVSGDIPAAMHALAQKQLTEFLVKNLPPLRARAIKTFITPRRIAFLLEEVSTVEEEEKLGPLASYGEKALEGFARSLSLSKEKCFLKETEKGQVWAAYLSNTRIYTQELLIRMCKKLLETFFWPKRMRWHSQKTWVRPILRLVCLYDKEVLPWTWEGITCGGETEGHRLWAAWKKSDSMRDTCLLFTKAPSLVLCSADSYEDALRDAFVLVKEEERRERIEQEVNQLAASCGCRPLKGFFKPLVEENASLTQWPSALLGSFDHKFLKLPPPVLATVLKTHQRCFPLEESNSEKIGASFIFISDLLFPDSTVTKGYERVVRARLEDALFFWEKDRSLFFDLSLLRHRSFFEGLGSLEEKNLRVIKLVSFLIEQTGHHSLLDLAQRASYQSKRDLVTSLVNEFPSLQGVVGRYCALEEGQEEALAEALEAQYCFAYPQGHSNLLGAFLALGEALDSLVGFFCLGYRSSGSKDPMGLRRTAHIFLRALLQHDLSFSLSQALKTALHSYHEQGYLRDCSNVEESILPFLKERWAYILKTEKKVPLYGLMAVKNSTQEDSILSWTKKVEFLLLLQETAEGQAFFKAYYRLDAFLRSCKKEASLSFSHLGLPQEQRLLWLLQKKLCTSYLPLWTEALHNFFDIVYIQDPVEGLARRSLLRAIEAFFMPWGNLSLMIS